MNKPTFSEFSKSVTPKGAEARVKEMLSTGQISKKDIDNAISTAKRLGLI